MNKKLTLPISLLACFLLLVGCSGQKKDTSSPDGNNSSGQEIPPEPEKDEGLEIFDSLETAKFINLGDVGDSSAAAKEVEKSGRGLDYNYLSSNATEVCKIEESSEYYFDGDYYDFYSLQHGVEKYNNDITNSYYDIERRNEVNGICNVLIDYLHLDYLTVKKDDTQYLRVHIKPSGSDPMTSWEIDDEDYFNINLEQIYDSMYLYLSEFYYSKIGSYHYFSYIYMDCDRYEFTDYNDIDSYTFMKMISQEIYKFDEEYNFLGFYSYREQTVDHNLFSGQLLESPKIVSRSLSSITYSYDKNPYPNEKGLIASIPTHQIINAEASFKEGGVTLDENGKIATEPSMPTNFSIRDSLEYVDDEHFAICFEFFPTEPLAFQLKSLVVRDTILQGEDKGSNKTYTISFEEKSMVEKVANALDVTYQLYGGVYYILMEPDENYGFKIIIPAFEEPTASNIEIIAYEPSFILLP